MPTSLCFMQFTCMTFLYKKFEKYNHQSAHFIQNGRLNKDKKVSFCNIFIYICQTKEEEIKNLFPHFY